MKKVFKNRKGFSLAEMMIVVAIIAVLCGVGAVGISNYRKKLNQLHYDSNAEILFNAAQNRITELYAANGASVFQKYSGETTKRITSAGNRELLLESVSEDILGNHWAITFNPLTGIVYEAFYSETVDPDGLTATVIEKKNGFRANGAGTVGYYGIHDSEGSTTNPEYPGTEYSSVPDYRCSLSIINKDILKARIELSHPGANLTITVRGKTTNESAVITADIPADKKTYEFVIDSVTTSFAENSLFSDFIPGEDLEISVSAAYGTAMAPTVSAVTNSLFAAKNGNIVTVRYGRHLQNLDAERFPATGAITAVIDKSIDFTDLSDANLWGSLYPGRTFDPINNSQISMLVASNTDGSYAERTINGLKVDTTGNGGLFGTFSGSRILGINLIGAEIKATGNAGALAGTTEGSVAITNCSSYLLYENLTKKSGDALWPRISAGSGSGAGGLVGASTGKLMIRGCSASSVISGGTSAGGLFGSAESVSMTGSYADCYVTAATNVGGLGGNATTASIISCYSAGYVLGTPADAAGYISGSNPVKTKSGSYSVFDYLTGDKKGTIFDKKEIADLGDRFVSAISESGASTTPYNISGIPEKDSRGKYEYPMLLRYNYTDSSPSQIHIGEVMHHYGDWEAKPGLGITWDNSANQVIIGEKTKTITPSGSSVTSLEVVCPQDWSVNADVDWKSYRYGGKKYRLAGWRYGKDGKLYSMDGDGRLHNGNVEDAANILAPIENENAVFTAEYVEVVTVTFQTTAAGGTEEYDGEPVGRMELDVPIGTDFWSIAPEPEDFSRGQGENGLTFFGWWLEDSTCSNNDRRVGTEGFPVTENLTVYTRWKCELIYAVVKRLESDDEFYPDIEESGDPIYEDLGTEFGDIYSRPSQTDFASGNTGNDDEEGLFLFDDCKWYTNRSCTTGFEMAEEDSVDTNLTLYTKWKCRLTYDPAALSDVAETIEYVDYGSTFNSVKSKDPNWSTVESVKKVILEKNNAGRANWYNGTNYDSDGVYTSDIVENITVYARWKCRVTYNAGRAEVKAKTDGTPFTKDVLVDYGSAFSSNEVNESVNGNAYPFGESVLGLNGFYKAGESSAFSGSVTENMTVTAKWKGVILHSETWSEGYRKCGFAVSNTQNLPDILTQYSVPQNPADPSHRLYSILSGYNTSGWRLLSGTENIVDRNGNIIALSDYTKKIKNPDTQDEEYIYYFDANDVIDLYAHWVKPLDYFELVTTNNLPDGRYIIANGKSGTINVLNSQLETSTTYPVTGGNKIQKKLTEVDPKAIWEINHTGDSYYIYNAAGNCYLGNRENIKWRWIIFFIPTADSFSLVTRSDRNNDYSNLIEGSNSYVDSSLWSRNSNNLGTNYYLGTGYLYFNGSTVSVNKNNANAYFYRMPEDTLEWQEPIA